MSSKIAALKKEYGGVLLTQEEFERLLNYAPKKTEIGVSWREKLDAGAEEFWVMGTYISHPQRKDGFVGVKWAFIEIASPSKVLAFRRAAKAERERLAAVKPSPDEVAGAVEEFEESIPR